jgi:nucleotide-binding universal stress UspA family protein
MHETILVPLDGSSAAEIVFPFVEEIAAKLGSRIILVTVSESGSADLDHLFRSYLERVREQVQTQLKDYGAEEVSKLYSKVLLGAPADEILRYADEADASLIVMASRGSSGRGPWLLGSIAGKVLRASGRPVLLIRAPADATALQQKSVLKRILVPLDGSVIGEAAIPFTEALGKALYAELVLYHVVEPVTTWAGYGVEVGYNIPQDSESRKVSALAYLEGVRKRLTEKGLITTIEVEAGRAADLIIDYAKSKPIDIIAMSTHGRSGIGRWVFGSVTDKVLHSGDAAVLVVRAAKT